MTGIRLFEGASGRLLIPSNPLDPNLVLTWNVATQLWEPGAVPGGSGGGGGMGFPFTFSTDTTDGDPGAGTFRGDNATLALSTQLFVDNLEYGGSTVSGWLATFDDSIASGKGKVRVQSKSDESKWIEWPVTGYTNAGGYAKIALGTAITASPGGILTTAGDTQLILDAGATGGIPVTAIDGTGASASQQVRRNSANSATEWFTPTSFKVGADLTDANQTETRAGGALYQMPAGVATAARVKTAGISGLNNTTHLGFTFQYIIEAQAFDITIQQNGPGTATLHVVPAGEAHVVDVEWNGTDFVPAGWTDLQQ